MMLLQAGQMGLYRKDSIWTSDIPTEMVAGCTMWLDFTDTLTLYAGTHLDGGNVTTPDVPVGSVENKLAAGYGVVAEAAGASGNLRVSATPSGKNSVVLVNSTAVYYYYEMQTAATNGDPMSALFSASNKTIIAAVKVAGSTPFNGYDMNGGDIIFGDNEYFALFVTEDSGVISARASNQVTFPDQCVGQAIGRNTWVILTASHQGGSLRIRVNGGAWTTVSSGATGNLTQNLQSLVGHGSSTPSEITLAHIATINTAQTDAAISAVEHWIANDVGISPWW